MLRFSYNHLVMYKLRNNFSLLRPNILKNITNCRNKSSVSTVDETELDPNQPIKFSTSRAAAWKSNYKQIINNAEPVSKEEKLKLLSITICYAVFVLYIFNREGNDLDEEIGMPLGKRMLLLQEYQLNLERKERQSYGGDTSDLDEQQRKIDKLRVEYKYV